MFFLSPRNSALLSRECGARGILTCSISRNSWVLWSKNLCSRAHVCFRADTKSTGIQFWEKHLSKPTDMGRQKGRRDTDTKHLISDCSLLLVCAYFVLNHFPQRGVSNLQLAWFKVFLSNCSVPVNLWHPRKALEPTSENTKQMTVSVHKN